MMQLWRPVGPKELALIEASAWRRFPPRLPEQPIFYPVLTFDYAEQIARDWNSQNVAEERQGFVVMFEVDDRMADKYPAQVAGGAQHRELWVPAEDMDDFNAAITGEIRVVARYRNGQRLEEPA